jgi:hypothetical protein
MGKTLSTKMDRKLKRYTKLSNTLFKILLTCYGFFGFDYLSLGIIE